jgi:hypothetical protein
MRSWNLPVLCYLNFGVIHIQDVRLYFDWLM